MYGLIEKTDKVIARSKPKPNTLPDYLLNGLEILLEPYPDHCVLPGTVRCPACGTLNNQVNGVLQGPCRDKDCREFWMEG
jgi:hypothetical protein